MPEITSKPGNNPAANSENFTPIGGSTKRLVNIVLATFGIVISLPLFSLCALGTFLSSPGSVISRHRRVGLASPALRAFGRSAAEARPATANV
jgi:lipopolysaccharide/colanic/teichoic acid biosynthesis glycosyltransferase